MGRIGKLVLKDQNIARKFGYLHPDVSNLFNYIYEEFDFLRDEDLIKSLKIVRINTERAGIGKSFRVPWRDDDGYLLTARLGVESPQMGYGFSLPDYLDTDSYLHLVLYTQRDEEIDIHMPRGVLIDTLKYDHPSISPNCMTYRAMLYLSAYCRDNPTTMGRIETFGTVITNKNHAPGVGHHRFLRILDITKDDNILRNYVDLIYGANKEREIVDVCETYDFNELLMRFLRIAEEEGLRHEEQLRL